MKLSKNNYGQLIAEGGEGFIYDYSSTEVLKIYKDHINLSEKHDKLQLMLTKSFPSNVISVKDLVYNSANKFVGYTMPKVSGDDFKSLSNKKYVKANSLTKKDIAGICSKVAQTLEDIHNLGFVIGDFNDKNILINSGTPYFIDVDSWAIDRFSCDAAMDLFKDPLLVGNTFTKSTDYYCYAVLLFKSLTRLHPYGGVYIENGVEVDISDRISRRISVINKLNKITIPATVDSYTFMPPKLIEDLEFIFDKDKRFVPSSNLNEFLNRNSLCKVHSDYYSSLYDKCPICNADAKANVFVKPDMVDAVSNIAYRTLLSNEEIKVIFNKNVYLTNSNTIVLRNTGKTIPYVSGYRYLDSESGEFYVQYGINKVDLVGSSGSVSSFGIAHKSAVVIDGNIVYYLSPAFQLMRAEYVKSHDRLSVAPVLSGGINTMFEVSGGKYFVVVLDSQKILINSGNYVYLKTTDKIMAYGLHYDRTSDSWLFIYENGRGTFKTYIIKDSSIVFETDKIRYSCDLSNLSIDNDTMYIPSTNKIVGFNWKKNAYKDFNLAVVSEDCKLIKNGSKFTAININSIVEIG